MAEPPYTLEGEWGAEPSPERGGACSEAAPWRSCGETSAGLGVFGAHQLQGPPQGLATFTLGPQVPVFQVPSETQELSENPGTPCVGDSDEAPGPGLARSWLLAAAK